MKRPGGCRDHVQGVLCKIWGPGDIWPADTGPPKSPVGKYGLTRESKHTWRIEATCGKNLGAGGSTAGL